GGLYRIAQEALTRYQQRRTRAALQPNVSQEDERGETGVSLFLPRPLTSFVGRELELEAVSALLQQENIRLMTLTGPGGVGKTRLSGEVIARVQGAFRDGVWFVPLVGIRSHDLVLPTIALALGLRDTGEVSLERRLREYLRMRHVLL